MKKIHFSIMLFMVFIFGQIIINAQVYDTNDSLRVRNFLVQQSNIANISNGEQLNSLFDANVPSTWTGFSWVADSITTKMRLSAVNIINSNQSGNLNLLGCDYLTNLLCSDNVITAVNVADSKALIMINCSNNLIESLDLSNQTILEYLSCENNLISYLDIHNSNILTMFTAQSNNLSFNRLKMPTNMANINKAGWNIGKQKLFIPDDVKKLGEIYYCEGMIIDFSTLKGLNYNWKVMPNVTLFPISDYNTQGTNNDIFIFNESRVNNIVFCSVTNTNTHYNLVMESVPFKLSYSFNNNDVAKLRYFLEQQSIEPGIKNGHKVNVNYSANDPRTFGVIWQPTLNDNDINEMRCISIETYDFKELAGKLDLSEMNKLEQVIVKGNSINDINLKNNSNLYYLDCSDNEISKLETTDLTELLTLICNDNFISDLNLSNNKKLNYCNSNNNILSNINLENLNRLEELYCKNNKISILDISDLENITRLYLDSNNIEILNLNSLIRLEIFSAKYNLLKELDLSNCDNLLNIFVNNNELINLDLTGLKYIERLDCSNNKLDFNKIKLPTFSLNTFYSYTHPQDSIGREKFRFHNGIYYTIDASIDLSDYVYTSDITYFNLYTIDVNGNKHNHGSNTNGKFNVNDIIEGQKIVIEAQCSTFPGLTLTTPAFVAKYEYDKNDVDKLRAFLNQSSKFGTEENGLTNGIVLNSEYDADMPSTYSVHWQKINGLYRLAGIDWQDVSNLKGELDLSNIANLRSININCGSNLERNDITSLNLNNCSALEYIFASYCQLETLNIDNCTKLKYIDATHNKISNDIEIVSQNITHIILTDNKIKNISASNIATLTNFYIGYNNLEELDVRDNVSLLELECNNNFISTLVLGEISELLYINFADNKITTLDLNNNTKIREIYGNNNQLIELLVNSCIELSALECANNKLINLNLIDIPYLYNLKTENNALTFKTLQYKEIANEILLHPQAIVYPKGIDKNHILLSDTLDLQDYFIENDFTGTIFLRYASNDELVQNNLYFVKDNILSNFDKLLKDTTMYIEMTHPHYPNLILRTVNFNTIRPLRYNENEVAALRHFLNQSSKINGLTNGLYLSENYNSDLPETFPGVEWTPIDPEFHVATIKWNSKSDLQGYINLNYMYLMDTLQINGTNDIKTGIDSIIIDYCYALKEIQLQNNNLSKIKLDRSEELEVVNLANNNLTALDITNLDNINTLDISNNSLIFNTFNLTHRPENITWAPQKEIIPFELLYYNDRYELIRKQISLSEFGNNVSYDWKSAELFEIIKYEEGSFEFHDTDNHKIFYCILTANDELKQGFTLQTVSFYTNFYSSVNEKLIANCNIYPNPTSEIINVNINEEVDAKALNINILDISGKHIKSLYQGDFINFLTLNLNEINVGTYFIQIIADEKQTLLPITINK